MTDHFNDPTLDFWPPDVLDAIERAHAEIDSETREREETERIEREARAMRRQGACAGLTIVALWVYAIWMYAVPELRHGTVWEVGRSVAGIAALIVAWWIVAEWMNAEPEDAWDDANGEMEW